MSVLGRKWFIKNTDHNKTTIEKILQNRGLLTESDEKVFHDPFCFRDMRKAVDRIRKAIENKERIIIFGDYDVDGITGTAILYHVLRKLNATASYRLPNRVEDGYGLSEKFIDEFIEKDIKILITTDCGISCKNEIEKAAANGIDTIITDHHTIPGAGSPEKAFAILHPKEKNSNYPFKGLTGAGVALKFAEALISELPPEEKTEIRSSLIDFASLGTVADLGPIKGENWMIVKTGLANLAKTKWVGLKKIMELAKVKYDQEIDSATIGYRIAPRINAAGRIGDPYLALSLLLQENPSPKVDALGKKLEELNDTRKDITLVALMEAQNGITEGNMPYIFIKHSKDWHVGILGLIAGRLAENYARPAIIMQDFGDVLVGSARSPEFFNIVEALTANKEFLESFGGHEQAAGFNLKKENLKLFSAGMEKFAKKFLKKLDLRPKLQIDCAIREDEVSSTLMKQLSELKPFGVDNEAPTLLLQGIEASFVEQVGRDKEHLKFTARLKNEDINVIAFRMGNFADDLRKHRKINLVFNLEKNVWNNRESMQLHALDFEKAKE